MQTQAIVVNRQHSAAVLTSQEGPRPEMRSCDESTLSVGCWPARLVLVVIIGCFLLVRVPLVLRQTGGLDEDFYAPPGWTVMREGIPRIPTIPQRDPGNGFYRADECLYAMPPASFYWQAMFFLVCRAEYPTARLASIAAAVLALWAVTACGQRMSLGTMASLCGTGLFSLSRPLYFPAITARPDMLCAVLGLTAILATLQWRRTALSRWLWIAGALLGLAGLTHPIAIVPAIQVGVWVFVAGPRGRGRWIAFGAVMLSSLLIFSLWLPLILRDPEAFRLQFTNNILGPTGPGLLQRAVWPWAVFMHHGRMLWEHAGPLQLGIMGAGVATTGIAALRGRSDAGERRGPASGLLFSLAISAVYLLCVFEGFHTNRAYWCYPAALLFLCVGCSMAHLERACRGSLGRRALLWSSCILLLAAMVPGSGFRNVATHLRHWDNVNYDGPRFAQMLIEQIPADSRCTVDTEFSFDFLVSGRPTIMLKIESIYLDARDYPADYVVVSRHSLRSGAAAKMAGEHVGTYGLRNDEFACYAEVYRTSGTEAP